MEVLHQDEYEWHCIQEISSDLRSTAGEKRQTIYQPQLESTRSVSSSQSLSRTRSNYERASPVNGLEANYVTW